MSNFATFLVESVTSSCSNAFDLRLSFTGVELAVNFLSRRIRNCLLASVFLSNPSLVNNLSPLSPSCLAASAISIVGTGALDEVDKNWDMRSSIIPLLLSGTLGDANAESD